VTAGPTPALPLNCPPPPAGALRYTRSTARTLSRRMLGHPPVTATTRCARRARESHGRAILDRLPALLQGSHKHSTCYAICEKTGTWSSSFGSSPLRPGSPRTVSSVFFLGEPARLFPDSLRTDGTCNRDPGRSLSRPFALATIPPELPTDLGICNHRPSWIWKDSVAAVDADG